MSIALVVFSKDRALQCASLLRSVKDHCAGISNVFVIFNASTPLHLAAYVQMRDGFASEDTWALIPDEGRLPIALGCVLAGGAVKPMLGQSLDGLKTFLDRCVRPDHIALAVDDQIFYAPSNFAAAAEVLDLESGFVWSWRLGNGKYAVHVGALNYWTCSALDNDPDYGYLFHSDGALYRTTDYMRMLDAYLPDWRMRTCTPNDLEAAVAGRKAKWAAHVGPHLGQMEPTCITWQLNRVQTLYGSPAAEIPETNVDALATAYLEGKRVDNEKLYAALRANPFRWNPPGTRPTHVYACEEASRFWAECVR